MSADSQNPGESQRLLSGPGDGDAPAARLATRQRQLSDFPRDELAALAEEMGIDATRLRAPQEIAAAIHERRQLIAGMDREAMLDVIRWGRRPIHLNASQEQIAQEITRIRTMRFGGLSQRGLVALAQLRGIEAQESEAMPLIIRRLKRQEGLFGKLNRKRRAMLGSIVANLFGENESSADYQFLPPPTDGAASPPGNPPAATQVTGKSESIKDEIEESGLFGGITNRIKRTADQYLNHKLDEVEARIDRKLDEIDRRLGEWRDKEIANRIKILKITLWASVIVAIISLIYSYITMIWPH